MQVIALVDFDNVQAIVPRNSKDIEFIVDELLDKLVDSAKRVEPHVSEITVRLYGGWVDERGNFSDRAQWAIATLPNVRGRRQQVRIQPHLAVALHVFPDDVLIGTLRYRYRERRAIQKMVDCLIAVDAIQLADQYPCGVLIVSDDDDLVPCALAIRGSSTAPCHLIRIRDAGRGLNDELLKKRGVSLGALRPERGGHNV